MQPGASGRENKAEPTAESRSRSQKQDAAVRGRRRSAGRLLTASTAPGAHTEPHAPPPFGPDAETSSHSPQLSSWHHEHTTHTPHDSGRVCRQQPIGGGEPERHICCGFGLKAKLL
ncbi:hypothetical protein EYF80_061864 [Liparis tanakae]|uniref:Uncharacterized protein n=1 Tax=Liparis tanakae TaxID=230148 RepID=A0A4Z2EGC2_9TELE|nr:hypothetical protein EYF80_061864 [Liparis tanakae]